MTIWLLDGLSWFVSALWRGERALPSLRGRLLRFHPLDLGGCRIDLTLSDLAAGRAYSRRTPIYLVGGDFRVECIVMSVSDGGPMVVYCRRPSAALRKGLSLQIMGRHVDTVLPFWRCLSTVSTGEHMIRDILLGLRAPLPSQEVHGLQFSRSDLDISQQSAVMKLLSISSVAVLEGPPGTGKTFVLGKQTLGFLCLFKSLRGANYVGELVLQSLYHNSSLRILCIAESNSAIDVLCCRLKDMGLTPIRDAPHFDVHPG